MIIGAIDQKIRSLERVRVDNSTSEYGFDGLYDIICSLEHSRLKAINDQAVLTEFNPLLCDYGLENPQTLCMRTIQEVVMGSMPMNLFINSYYKSYLTNCHLYCMHR